MDFHLLPMLFVTALTAAGYALLVRQFAPKHRPWLALSLVGHLIGAYGNLYLVFEVYGYGDLLMYQYFAVNLAEAMSRDLLRVVPGALQVFLQLPNPLSVFVPSEGSSVASMVVVAAFGNLVMLKSLLATSMLFAALSFFGKLALLQALLETTPRRHHPWVVLGTMLVPSSVFWSGGLIKEAVAMPAFGLFMWGLVRVAHGRYGGLAPLGVGALVVGLIKPYILLVAFGAAGIYLYAKRSFRAGQVTVRPLSLLMAGGVALGGMIVVGEVFPQFSLDNLAEETARMQRAALRSAGGSTYAIGDPSAGSYVGQLAFVPFGLLTGLFRPFLFEARNPQMALAALETTAFLGGTLYVFWKRSLRDLASIVIRYPILTFCIAFTVVFGIATGLTSVNLGTLSRYRMPLVPFFATTLILLIRVDVPRRATGRVGPLTSRRTGRAS